MSGRLLKHAVLFQDFGEIACAAQRHLAHQTLYGPSAICPSINAAPYVYPPWVADAVSIPLRWAGHQGLSLGYLALFLVSAAALLWFACGLPIRGVKFIPRIAFMGFVAGGPLAFGNIAIVLHASICAAALYFGADSVGLAIFIGLAALAKPQFLLLLAIPLLSRAKLARKLILVAAVIAAVGAVYLAPWNGMDAWRHTVGEMMAGRDRGGGFVSLMAMVGVHDTRVLGIAYIALAAALLGSAWCFARWSRLEGSHRLWLGYTVGVLMFPRLMCYDVLVLGPGIMAALSRLSQVDEIAGIRLNLLAFCCCCLCLVSTLAGGVLHIGRDLSYLGLWALVILLAIFSTSLRTGPVRRGTNAPTKP